MKSHYRNLRVAVAALAAAFSPAALADLSGNATLAVNTSLNLDTGVTASAGGDILFTGSSINPQGGAGAVNFSKPGFVEFDALTLAVLSMITPINYMQVPLSGTSLVANDVFAVYTNGGHYAKILITAVSSQSVSLQYTTYGASAPGGPTIAQVLNNYSFILPGLPNYGIAPGSLFVVSGTNLSSSAPPVLQSSAAPGLPRSLNQTSISVTVNGVTTIPALYYTSETQVAAVLPSTTPVGTGKITLSYNGQLSAGPIQVVPSALGLDTVYGIGTGQGVITDTSYNLLGFTHAAQPGQTVILWGSGVGPDLSNDDRTYPLNQDNLTNVPMQIYISGISANIVYRGRSQYPGVDQVDVVIPSNVAMGCFVSVVAVSGPIVSNTVTLPISVNGLACSDSGLNYFGGQFRSLAGKTNVGVGIINVAESYSPAGTATWSAVATFQVVQSGLYGSGYGDASEGSCVVIPPAASAGGPFQFYGLDAGIIAVTWPGGLDIMNEAPGAPGIYSGTLAPGPPDPGPQGIQYSFVGTGGKDLGPFSGGLTLESPPLNWVNQGALTSVSRSQGATVTWTDSTSGLLNDVEISGSSSVTTGGATLTVSFSCHAPVTAGQFTVPPSILMALPAGVGTLSVAHTFNAIYPENGPLDLFEAFGRVGFSQNTTYN